MTFRWLFVICTIRTKRGHRFPQIPFQNKILMNIYMVSQNNEKVMASWSNDQLNFVLRINNEAKDTLITAKDAEIARKDGEIARKDGEIARKDADNKTLYERLLLAQKESDHFKYIATDCNKRLRGFEEARDIRTCIETYARTIHAANANINVSAKFNGFPGVQSILDKHILTDAVFVGILQRHANRVNVHIDLAKKRFRNIYDTLSKEFHSSSETFTVRTSKFSDVGDRIAILALLEFVAIPYDIVED